MATNAGLFTITTSIPDRIRVWLKQAWETIKPGPLAWKGAALGLLVVAVFSILIASYRPSCHHPVSSTS